MMSMCQISSMSVHLTRFIRFPSASTVVQQEITMCNVMDLVDSKDAREVAEMSRSHTEVQQGVTMHDMTDLVDSEDVREVAEMSQSHVDTRVKSRMRKHTSCTASSHVETQKM